MDGDPFDFEGLQIDPANMPKVGKQKKWRRQFVRVPWGWVEQLRAAKHIGTYRLALLLLYESWRLGGKAVVLSNVSAHAEGLPARSKWRALAELEALGLIEVQRRRCQAPRVVLLDT